ncbi:A49-like RNA polymerase I associated factor [Colletotrichum karsti]|uniref:A49-like RNA polymerase I associated factor n=1 Tax=Colletotrichum karsti TaxID=1095194 RepID=A0A9P6IB96_9PEZI|nr:A49-like RNA polymerase I associated factor [Colletotrichum karsti]KAF9877371.1 A49-like RNA polymerase I associated factor [Colletotrichum karsti]
MADTHGRKRKRDGDGAAKTKKKLATEGSAPSKVTISSILRPNLCPPVIACSPGVRLPKNVPFSPYVKPETTTLGKRKQKTPAVSQDLILHSNSHQTMDYTARDDGISDSQQALKHYVGAFDPKTGKLEVVEAKKMVVRGTARAKQASDEAMTAPADYESYYALKTDLGQTFGTRKAKKAIESVTLNAIDPNKGKSKDKSPQKLDTASKAILAEIGGVTKNMASREQLQAAVDQAKPVPRANLEAEAIQDVYDPNEIIGRDILAAVPIKDWVDPTKKGEALQVYSKHVATRLQKVVDTGNVEKIRLLRYFYLLFLFFTMCEGGKPGQQRGVKRVPFADKIEEKLSPAPKAVIEHIRRKFSDGKEWRKFHKDLVITHACAIASIIDNFEVDTAALREDLRLEQKDINNYFSEIGGRVVQSSSKEKGKPPRHIGKLALPLQFPKLRSVAPKRR